MIKPLFMLTRDVYADETANVVFFIPAEKRNVFKRLIKRMKRKMKRMKSFFITILPNHWFDHFLDELEIDLEEFK